MYPQPTDQSLKLTNMPIDVVPIRFDFPHHSEIEALRPEASWARFGPLDTTSPHKSSSNFGASEGLAAHHIIARRNHKSSMIVTN